ncbi:MAG: hypothetical protein ACRD97_07285 [Nitrososphaeraceae archaeon]
MSLDKSVNKLIDRIEKLDSSNGNNKCDGSNFWKGKKIISLDLWFKISNTNYLSGRDNHRIKDGLEYFPKSYHPNLFPRGVPDNFRELVNVWHKEYIELMDYIKDENLGKQKCTDCLLSPNNEGSYFGLYKFIANALQITNSCGLEDKNKNVTSIYPCQVVNFYSCPYDKKEESEAETVTRNDLFSLNQIAEIIGRALSKALNIKSNRIIYKIDFQLGKVREIDTFLCEDPYAQNLPGGKPIEHRLKEISERIEKLSILPMRNLDDIFSILTNEEKLDTVLQIGLDKQYSESKHQLVGFFMSIKGNVKREDLTIQTPLIHYVEKNKCSVCSQHANIDCINCIDKDVWLCVDHWKDHETNHY